MSAVTTLPFSRALTRADLDSMPDDGHRYELVDGTLVVGPAPRRVHQRAVYRLARLLDDACPSEEFEMLQAPFDVVLADDTVVLPDILVARSRDLSDKELIGAPLLAAEVLSPSTRRFDLMVKHSRLEAAGCPSYWVVDPDEPSLVAWELRGDSYVEVGKVHGDEVLRAELPYPVEVSPVALVERHG